jgi:hypothetical protein
MKDIQEVLTDCGLGILTTISVASVAIVVFIVAGLAWFLFLKL